MEAPEKYFFIRKQENSLSPVSRLTAMKRRILLLIFSASRRQGYGSNGMRYLPAVCRLPCKQCTESCRVRQKKRRENPYGNQKTPYLCVCQKNSLCPKKTDSTRRKHIAFSGNAMRFGEIQLYFSGKNGFPRHPMSYFMLIYSLLSKQRRGTSTGEKTERPALSRVFILRSVCEILPDEKIFFRRLNLIFRHTIAIFASG
jgi:hypothetical protein